MARSLKLHPVIWDEKRDREAVKLFVRILFVQFLCLVSFVQFLFVLHSYFETFSSVSLAFLNTDFISFSADLKLTYFFLMLIYFVNLALVSQQLYFFINKFIYNGFISQKKCHSKRLISLCQNLEIKL